MRIVVFGLSVSSSWGNGHATLWRGLIHALARLGHSVHFFEWNAPWYASHRDCWGLPNGELQLYDSWNDVRPRALAALRDAEIALVTSYCPDGIAASELVLSSRAELKVFYDLDTPVTLARVAQGEALPYLGPRALADFDLVLSYTGGAALDALRDKLRARRVAPLYGSVDTDLHAPRPPDPSYASDLSYLGTYASDRQERLNDLFLEPARRLPARRFAIGGSQYPQDFPWSENIRFFRHVPPAQHAAFYGSSLLNLNVTRAPMAASGYCPSGRLFEAAACAAAVISDAWQGLDGFFEPDREILIAQNSEDVVRALSYDKRRLSAIGRAARERVFAEHTVDHRAREFIAQLEAARAAPRAQADEPMQVMEV